MYCHLCAKETAPGSKFCPSCGAALSIGEERIPSRSKQIFQSTQNPSVVLTKQRFLLIILLLGLLLGGLIFNGLRMSGVSFGSTKWVPSGYTALSSDSNIAYKWADVDKCSSLASQGCFTVEVMTNKVCSQMLYVEANEYDASGNILGVTNASLGRIDPGEVARLELVSIWNGAKAKLAKIQCL